MSKEVEKDETQASESQDAVEKNDTQAAEDQIDYKAELERTKQERDNYKQGMLKAKSQLKQQKGEKEDIEDEDSEKSDDEIAQLRAEIAELRTSQAYSGFDAVIGEFSNDPDEVALIKYHFENSVGQTGSLRDRIENAYLIANKKKFSKESSEMKRALTSRAGVSHRSTGGGGSQSTDKVEKDFFSPEQIATLKARGLDPEKVKENYLKLKNKN